MCSRERFADLVVDLGDPLGEPITLNQQEHNFLGEVVFLLKTFFFVYVGVSIRFTDPPFV
jgi:hypothetical protein